jgi:hypothetical protein
MITFQENQHVDVKLQRGESRVACRAYLVFFRQHKSDAKDYKANTPLFRTNEFTEKRLIRSDRRRGDYADYAYPCDPGPGVVQQKRNAKSQTGRQF